MSEYRNGHSILGGNQLPLAQALSPIIGARRCRISRPLKLQPTHVGRYGRGWLVDLAAGRKKQPPGTPIDATVAHWIVEAPWTSEVVHSYSLICVHLRFSLTHAPVVRKLEGATHEVGLWAIRPDVDREPLVLSEMHLGDAWLRPEVFAAQFVARDDGEAAQRMGHTVELICDGRLSPHPTHAATWASIFGGNMMRSGA